jgi:pimeloyl-ACP methyl ester carboxylesterase
MNETRHLARPGGRVAYDVEGPEGAPLVICLPGMGDRRQVYRFTVPALVAAGYRVATMDLRGHGDSDATFEASTDGVAPYGDVAAAGDALALVEHLGGRAVLFGNSMCAGASVIAAAARPDLVAGLVLAGPFVRNPPANAVLKTAMRVALMRPWGVGTWLMYYSKAYPSRRPADFVAYTRATKESLKRPAHWRAFVATTRQASHDPAERRLADVAVPSLVVMGGKDPDFKDPAAEAAFVAGALHAQLLMVDGAGHYPMAELPDVVNPGVLAFLAGVFGAGN